MAIRNPETREACNSGLPSLNYRQAVDELGIIRRQLNGASHGTHLIWKSKQSSIEMIARIYRLFGIFMERALAEYDSGYKAGALSPIMRALEAREMIPSEPLRHFLRQFKEDLRLDKLTPKMQQIAPAAARAARQDLKFFEQAPAKLRVVAAKIFLQLGGEDNESEAGRLFGEAIEIGLKLHSA